MDISTVQPIPYKPEVYINNDDKVILEQIEQQLDNLAVEQTKEPYIGENIDIIG